MMRPVRTHVQAAILRAIAAEAGLDGTDRQKPILVIEDLVSTDWASATFVGAQHVITVRVAGEAGAVAAAIDRMVAGLPERDMPICGHIVAEIAATPLTITAVETAEQKVKIGEGRVRVNVLTLVD